MGLSLSHFMTQYFTKAGSALQPVTCVCVLVCVCVFVCVSELRLTITTGGAQPGERALTSPTQPVTAGPVGTLTLQGATGAETVTTAVWDGEEGKEKLKTFHFFHYISF